MQARSSELSSLQLYRLLRSGASARLRQSVARLLQLGACPNFRPRWRFETATMLGLAVSRSELGVVTMLLQAGARVRETFSLGCYHNITALHMAAIPPDFDNKYFWHSPCTVCCSSRCRHIRIVNALLQHGAEIDACDASGRTPLHYAVGSGMLACANCLYEHGADPHICDKGIANSAPFLPHRAPRNALQHLLGAWENFMRLQVPGVSNIGRVASSGSSGIDDEHDDDSLMLNDFAHRPFFGARSFSDVHADLVYVMSKSVLRDKVHMFATCASTLAQHGSARKMAFAMGLHPRSLHSPVNCLSPDLAKLVIQEAMPSLQSLVNDEAAELPHVKMYLSSPDVLKPFQKPR
jgi:ankyrin repeat protein